jgi:hypothetical protein
MPLSPLVRDAQRMARPHTTMPRARVIIRKYVPVARMAMRPKIAAARVATITPATAQPISPTWRSVARMATTYEAMPK